MNYRISSHDDYGFGDEEEEFYAILEQVQDFAADDNPEHLVDTLLVIMKVAELRALMQPQREKFYTNIATGLRTVLDKLSLSDPLPNQKLADDRLYLPTPKGRH